MQETIKSVISSVLGVPTTSIGEDFTMQSTDKWDSLAHMQLMAAFEEAFSLSEPLSLDEMITMTSLKAIESVLSSKAAA
jgi:acyl carrier protein